MVVRLADRHTVCLGSFQYYFKTHDKVCIDNLGEVKN